eukprot:CAMPEP_0201695326 /NCGR_PEP_ID=MMETSP0578-20130828/7331_1 /ASSEMBLY_ACC=CAM_ASM_000663 /TAXON_ID=267565 /ORGANISM="Skeletonema grethea, Strain CCMP 1804" /LENGTH=1306 /DNA_ID=CAMNT_0048181169 /DNA_START=426 /DNA_END=4346 /DNA_ORIENTATION=-
MSTSNNEPPRALSANASSFNPPSSEQIWGAINQSFGSGGGNNSNHPTAESSGSRPPSSSNGDGGHGSGGGHHQNRTSSSSHQSSHGTPPQGAGGGGETSGLGLWNFGGFGDEARTRPAPQAGRGGMLDDSNVNLDFMGDHGNQDGGDVSRLSSAFGNFGVNDTRSGAAAVASLGGPPPPSYNGRVSGAATGYNGQHQYSANQQAGPPGGMDNLSGPYPPSFPTGGSQGHAGGRGGYHQGPGWNQLPRWGGDQGAGQYGAAPPPPSQGYGGSRGQVPPYPRHDAYTGASGGYNYGPDGYPTDGYGSRGNYNRNDAYGGYAPPPQAGGNYREVPSFVPPQSQVSNGLYPPSFNPGARGSSSGNLDGPYPSSFNPPERTSSGVEPVGGVAGALSSILQTPYNPQQAAQTRRYPAILGGAPDPSPAGEEHGYGGDGSAMANVTAGLGLNTSGGKSSFLPPRSASTTATSTEIGDASPTPSHSSGVVVGEPADQPVAANGTTGASSFALPPPPEESSSSGPSILPKRIIPDPNDEYENNDKAYNGVPIPSAHDSSHKKREWLMQMNQTLEDTAVGQLDPNILPLSTIMNGWAKQKSSEGARMVEMWLDRVHSEYNSENPHGVHPTARMYTMAVDAWAKSNGGAAAARRAEALLERMDRLYREGGGRHEALKPTTGIFNAVINAWARSREKIAPSRAEQILAWMEKLRDTGGEDLDISPDKYTFNTVIHAYAKSGAKESATKAHRILDNMNQMYREGNSSVKPDTITYNVVINAYAKSGGKGAAQEAEHLLSRMHMMYDQGDLSVKPNVVTYGAVIDAFAKSMERNAAARADALLANMVALHQSDQVRHSDLRPNTYVFNTVINAWAKSKERGAAAKAEEMLVAMDRLHASGFPGLKPDAFTYTAVIDAYAKSGFRGAASRADLLLDQMEAKYSAGDQDLKPNTFTYNAVINALAKSGEPGAAARAERVLHNMVNRLRNHGGNDVKPTTINFNTVLDAWAKSGEGEAAAERAEAILEWMDRLNKSGNTDVKPDTITFNAVIDAWARSGCKRGPQRAEQILNHMDELYQGGNIDVKPDTYTYNTLINALAKSGDGGSAARAEEILSIMEQRYSAGDKSFKPNTRSHTSVIDAWAKSGEQGAAMRAEAILTNLRNLYENTKDPDIKPNVYTANAVMNACAFTKHDVDREEALEMAFRVFEWLDSQPDIKPDAYTFTIMLSVCANLIPKEEAPVRFESAKMLFEKCCESGHVNDHVLWKLKLTVNEFEYHQLVGAGVETKAQDLPQQWSRAVANNRKQGDSRNNNWAARNRRSRG